MGLLGGWEVYTPLSPGQGGARGVLFFIIRKKKDE